MEPLTLLVGAGIFAAGLLAGWPLGRRDRARRRDPELEPICGCGHHRAQHDPETSQCHKLVNIALRGYTPKFQQCTCQQYVGPEPISSLWTPPVLPEGSER